MNTKDFKLHFFHHHASAVFRSCGHRLSINDVFCQQYSLFFSAHVSLIIPSLLLFRMNTATVMKCDQTTSLIAVSLMLNSKLEATSFIKSNFTIAIEYSYSWFYASNIIWYLWYIGEKNPIWEWFCKFILFMLLLYKAHKNFNGP